MKWLIAPGIVWLAVEMGAPLWFALIGGLGCAIMLAQGEEE